MNMKGYQSYSILILHTIDIPIEFRPPFGRRNPAPKLLKNRGAPPRRKLADLGILKSAERDAKKIPWLFGWYTAVLDSY